MGEEMSETLDGKTAEESPVSRSSSEFGKSVDLRVTLDVSEGAGG